MVKSPFLVKKCKIRGHIKPVMSFLRCSPCLTIGKNCPFSCCSCVSFSCFAVCILSAHQWRTNRQTQKTPRDYLGVLVVLIGRVIVRGKLERFGVFFLSAFFIVCDFLECKKRQRVLYLCHIVRLSALV